MNIYELLNFPKFSQDFLNLDFTYKNFTVLVSGFLEVTVAEYKIPYDGNLVEGGYTDQETVNVKVTVSELQVYNDQGIRINKILNAEIIELINLNTKA